MRESNTTTDVYFYFISVINLTFDKRLGKIKPRILSISNRQVQVQ